MDVGTSEKKGNAVKVNSTTSTATEIKLTLENATLDTLKSAPIEVVDGLAKEFVKKGQKLGEIRDDVKDCTKRFALVLCVLGIRLELAQAGNTESRSTTLAEFAKRIAGRAPSNHELTLKNSVGTFVISHNPGTDAPFVTEKDWLGNGNNALELAQKITVAVKGDLSHPAVAQAAAILSENLETKKKGKALKALLDSLVPKEPMTAEKALEVIEAVFNAGHAGMCIAHLADLMKDATTERQKEVYLAIANTVQKLDVSLGENADLWSQEINDKQAPVNVVKAPEAVEAEAVAA